MSLPDRQYLSQLIVFQQLVYAVCHFQFESMTAVNCGIDCSGFRFVHFGQLGCGPVGLLLLQELYPRKLAIGLP